MADDPWRQWQAFMGLFAPPRVPGSPSRFESPEAHAFASYVQSAERFTAAARKYLEDTAQASAPAAAEAMRAFGDFLREQSLEVLRPLWSADFGAGAAGAASPMPDLPALGLTREHQQRWQRTAEAARRMADAQRRLQLLWSDTLREAATAFAARHAAPQSKAVDAEFLRGLYNSWIDCAEEAYARTAHSDAFCSAFAEFVNASSLCRKEVQSSVEHLAKSLDLPTRGELNTLTRRLQSVEEQLAALQAKHDTRLKDHKPRAAAGKARTTVRAGRARRTKRAPKS